MLQVLWNIKRKLFGVSRKSYDYRYSSFGKAPQLGFVKKNEFIKKPFRRRRFRKSVSDKIGRIGWIR
jgi:hypothetical protein